MEYPKKFLIWIEKTQGVDPATLPDDVLDAAYEAWIKTVGK